ncbi:hypothetical protein [Microbacterium sp. RU33B]|uniref:hypothetical protein n=1 Tax=Microbacterium sp. RU33B TaxID=1907390 RepID=UPI001C4C28F4|nr:hypothetical protein [Microbacterium sp. RU33B]
MKIVQAACFCKGYHAGDLNGEWDGVTTSGLSLSGHPTAALAMPLRTPNTPWKSDKSANGWPIGGPSSVFRIEGTNHSITLAVGSAAGVLLHAVRRFNYEIDALRDGDAKGLSTDRAVTSPERSNLLSGTAVLIRPDSFPLGTTGNLYPNEITILEDIVMEAGGVISWGGHLKIPDQGLLYIAKPPLSAATSRLAKRCDETDAMGTAGGVGQINAFERDRLREVELFLEQKVG